MSNFTFLIDDWPDLFAAAREAEQDVNSAPRTSCFYARRTLEQGVKWLYAINEKTFSSKAPAFRLRIISLCCSCINSSTITARFSIFKISA